MVHEQQSEYSSQWAAIRSMAAKIGCTHETLRRWVRQVERDQAICPAPSSDDNALAESLIGLYKAELIRKRRPWGNLEKVEYATLEWVGWFNNRRLLTVIGNVPPAKFEAAYFEQPDG